jgi:hypothetical protein
MSETKTILCGICHVPVERRINPDAQMMAVCANCGQIDTPENAVGEAGRHLIDKLTRETLAEFDAPGITVTQPPKRSYRFIFAD